ncbi:hypothetical protein [Flavobacterium pectinovorum]|uniref:Uncharacterized protein n=1 Tax=Flavobacterium pectinovorum TaxID=29533 RepID=A0A502F6G7_9FLAO|nr:hypothetical protein [Flavobacterium pectinovorum]TPG44366.1 hypothetical protein EAH81_02510 [Flavobacterium pectinovorum]
MAVREKVINLVLAVGQTEVDFTTALDSGFILGAELHTNHINVDNYAEFGIFDDSGVAFSKPTPIDHWKRREGSGFADSYKPLLFETEHKTFQFKVKTKVPVIKETYFALILMYKIKPECK